MRHRDSRIFWIERHVGFAEDACLPAPFPPAINGYVKVGDRTASHVMCELVHGPRPSPSFEAAHSCGRRDCVNPRHLSWKTRAGNEADKIAHGTTNRGSRSGNAKLNESQALAIRARSNETIVSLAREYGVNPSVVSRIRSGEAWRWAK